MQDQGLDHRRVERNAIPRVLGLHGVHDVEVENEPPGGAPPRNIRSGR